jgi:hypothetical protein
MICLHWHLKKRERKLVDFNLILPSSHLKLLKKWQDLYDEIALTLTTWSTKHLYFANNWYYWLTITFHKDLRHALKSSENFERLPIRPWNTARLTEPISLRRLKTRWLTWINWNILELRITCKKIRTDAVRDPTTHSKRKAFARTKPYNAWVEQIMYLPNVSINTVQPQGTVRVRLFTIWGYERFNRQLRQRQRQRQPRRRKRAQPGDGHPIVWLNGGEPVVVTS